MFQFSTRSVSALAFAGAVGFGLSGCFSDDKQAATPSETPVASSVATPSPSPSESAALSCDKKTSLQGVFTEDGWGVRVGQQELKWTGGALQYTENGQAIRCPMPSENVALEVHRLCSSFKYDPAHVATTDMFKGIFCDKATHDASILAIIKENTPIMGFDADHRITVEFSKLGTATLITFGVDPIIKEQPGVDRFVIGQKYNELAKGLCSKDTNVDADLQPGTNAKALKEAVKKFCDPNYKPTVEAVKTPRPAATPSPAATQESQLVAGLSPLGQPTVREQKTWMAIFGDSGTQISIMGKPSKKQDGVIRTRIAGVMNALCANVANKTGLTIEDKQNPADVWGALDHYCATKTRGATRGVVFLPVSLAPQPAPTR